jgi:hypothetical protein
MVQSHSMSSQHQPPKLLEQVRDAIRARHYSIRTEETYLRWIKRFILFHGRRHPREMGGQEVQQFLSHLAVEGRVAASTQNQALSAIVFLYQQVLKQRLLYSRRNVLPVQRIDGPLVMVSQHTAHALLELLEVRKTPPGPNPVLHHAPKTFDRIEMVFTARWQKMQTTLPVPVRKRRGELVRPMDPTAIDCHNDRFPGTTQDRPHVMDRLPEPLGLKMRDDFIEDF